MSKVIASLVANIGVNVAPFQQGVAVVKKNMAEMANDAYVAEKKNAMLGTAIAVTTALIAESYKEYSKLTENVRDLSLVSGESAESTSRFIQVLDDFQLSADDATTAARFLKEKGLTPNIETLAQLSDEFRKIKDPAERLKFIQENLGRGGAKWVNVLNQGGDALRSLSKDISANLIISEKQVKMYEVQRLAIDNLQDDVEGFKTQLGGSIANIIAYNEAMTRANEIYKEQGNVITPTTYTTQEYKDVLNGVIADMLRGADASLEYNESLADQEAAAKAAEDAIKAISDTISGQIGLINDIQSADEAYTEKSKDLASQRTETEQELADLRAQGYWEYGDEIQGALSKLDEIKQAEADLEKERERQSLEFISGILAENLARDGWTQAEFDAFAKQQEAWGLWSADVVAKSQAAWQEADKITASINMIPDSKKISIIIGSQIDSATQSYMAMAEAYGGGASSGGGSGINHRARGGSVNSGSPYIVGENGPEMFVPSSSGNIIPNNKLGSSNGGVTINIVLDSATPDPERVAYNLGPAVKRVLRAEGII